MIYIISFKQLSSKSCKTPGKISFKYASGSFRGQFMQTCPKISSNTNFAANPLGSVDLMSLYFVLLPLIWKCFLADGAPKHTALSAGMQLLHNVLILPLMRMPHTYAEGRPCACRTCHRRQMQPVWSKRTTEVNVELMFRSVCKEAKHLLDTLTGKVTVSCCCGAHGPTAKRMWCKAFPSKHCRQNQSGRDEERKLQNNWEIKLYN